MAFAFPPEPRSRTRVLIVEDDEDTRAMYAEFLGASFDVLQAADGKEALALAAEHRPDVIVTDMTLPGMDGFELVRRFRGLDVTSTTPVVSLSGHSGRAHEEKARKAGCDRIVQKPCLPDVLADTLLQLLAETRKRSEL